MAQQIKKKFIGADQVDGSKIKLINGQSLRGVNSQGQEVDLLKLSSQDKIQVLGQEVSLKSELQQEILDRQSGDSSTLVSAKSYADSQVSSEASLRSAADAVLDSKILAEKARIDAILGSSQSDKDSFAEIVQLINSVDTENDSAFGSYAISNNAAVSSLRSRLDVVEPKVSTLESGLASEISARTSADTSLQTQITALRDFRYDQTVHVATNGVDTNTGRQHSPFLTISAALNSITDASPTKRYAIMVSAGNYTESSIQLKPNVWIVGSGTFLTRITGAVSLHSSFTGSADHRSGFADVTLNSAVDFNWATVTSQAGKIYFRDVQCLSTVTMYGHNNAIAQCQLWNCIFVGNLTFTGINVQAFQNNVCFSNIILNQHPNGGMVTWFLASGGYCAGTITMTAATNDLTRRISAIIRAFPSEQIVLNGPAAYCDADLVSQGKSLPTISNGASLVAINPYINHDITTKKITSEVITPKTTNAHNMGDWGKQWNWNFGNIHASTGTDLWLVSYPASYAPDSSGKWVCINSDGAGLQNNVDGGSIELVTAQTSGTGVRGEIILDARQINASNVKIVSLANGVAPKDAVNKGQLDASSAQSLADSKLYTDGKVAPKADKTYVDSQVSGIQSQVNNILSNTNSAALDSLTEVVSAFQAADSSLNGAISSLSASATSALNAEITRATSAEAALDGRVSALESDALEFEQEKFTLTSTHLSNGYVDLAQQAKAKSIVAHINRLGMFETDHYTLSVVSGKTRVSFTSSELATMQVGDVVRFSYHY